MSIGIRSKGQTINTIIKNRLTINFPAASCNISQTVIHSLIRQGTKDNFIELSAPPFEYYTMNKIHAFNTSYMKADLDVMQSKVKEYDLYYNILVLFL